MGVCKCKVFFSVRCQNASKIQPLKMNHSLWISWGVWHKRQIASTMKLKKHNSPQLSKPVIHCCEESVLTVTRKAARTRCQINPKCTHSCPGKESLLRLKTSCNHTVDRHVCPQSSSPSFSSTSPSLGEFLSTVLACLLSFAGYINA